MILDKRTEFLDATDVFSSTSADLVGDVIDMGPNQRDPGQGQQLWWMLLVTTAFVGGTSFEFSLRSDAVAAVNPSTGTLHISTGAIVVASLAAEARFMLALPVEGLIYERFLGLIGTSVGAVSAGAITSGLTLDPAGWKPYPEGLN